MMLISRVEGTPYIAGGNSTAGTDCSGLAAWVSNIATGRDPFSGRFTTSNEGGELASRGFMQGAEPNALVIGWNGGHTAVTLPDGTPVASGERGGVHIGGGGAYQAQFTNHMFLPMEGLLPMEEAPTAKLDGWSEEVPLSDELPPEEPPTPVGRATHPRGKNRHPTSSRLRRKSYLSRLTKRCCRSKERRSPRDLTDQR